MATIQKRGDSYKITVSCGYDLMGKQIRHHLTWKPAPGMTARQIKKELDRQAHLFEERCLSGQVLDGNITLADFIDRWFRDYAEIQLRATTVAGYRKLLKRTLPALGHIRLEKLKPHHLMAFYKNLAEPGIRKTGSMQRKPLLASALTAKGWNAAELARQTGLTPSRISFMMNGHGVSAQTAQKIANTLEYPLDELFQPARADKPLSSNSIQKYHAFLSSVLSTAVKWQVIFANPCERVDPPKVIKKEAKYLDEAGAVQLLTALEKEPIQKRAIVRLLLDTGMRRAELCGLGWDTVDLERAAVTIGRSSLYLPTVGVFTDDTKTEASHRVCRIAADTVQLLRELRAWQNEQRFAIGDQWQNSGRVFTAWNGAPIHPDSITGWFTRFVKKHDLPPVTIHSLRHTNATLLIAAGTNIRTVSNRLGHSQTSTTMNIYAHAIQSADAAAAEALGNILNPVKKRASGI